MMPLREHIPSALVMCLYSPLSPPFIPILVAGASLGGFCARCVVSVVSVLTP